MKKLARIEMSRELEQLIGEAVGEASMCWDPLPTGIFDSTKARKIVDRVAPKLKLAGLGDRAMKAGTALSLAGALGTAGYAGRKEYGAMAHGAVDAIRSTRHDALKAMKAKKIGSLPLLKSKKASAVTDAHEQAHNLLAYTHFFIHDNTRLHPAHREGVVAMEEGIRTLVKDLDKAVPPESNEKYHDCHTDKCKFAKSAAMAGFMTNAGRKASEFAGRQMLHVGRTIRDFKTPLKSMKAGWHADNTLGRAMTIGGAAIDVHDAIKKEDPAGKGRSRLERAGFAAGNTAGGLVGLRHGMFTGGIVGSLAGGYVASRAGRMISPRKPVVPQVPNQQMPSTGTGTY